MSKEAKKKPEILEDDFDEEVRGPGEPGKGAAHDDSAEPDRKGPSTAFYLHWAFLVGGRLLHMVMDAYNTIFDLNSKDKATIYRNLSTLHINKGQYGKALEYLEEWVQVEPANAQAHYHLGVALAAAGNNVRAISAFEAALKIKPSLKAALYRKSSLLLKTKDFARAAQGLEAMVKITPEDARTHYLLGIAYDGLGEIDKAIVAMQKAVDLDPQEVKYQQHLGFLHISKDDHKTAAKHFTKVMELERELEQDTGEF